MLSSDFQFELPGRLPWGHRAGAGHFFNALSGLTAGGEGLAEGEAGNGPFGQELKSAAMRIEGRGELFFLP